MDDDRSNGRRMEQERVEKERNRVGGECIEETKNKNKRT